MQKVKIEKLDHQGRGIAYTHNKPFFIFNALPDEEVEIKIIEEKKKYGLAEVNKVIVSSPIRQKPICPYFEKCGGCDLMHLSYTEQIKFKQNKIINICGRFANIDESIIQPIIFSDNPLYYRNKVTFQHNNCVGFYGKKSHDLVEIEHCYIATSKINKVLEKLKELDMTNVEKIIVKTDRNVEEVMVVFETCGKVDNKNIVSELKDITTSIIVMENNNETVLYGSPYILFPISEYQFEVSSSSFFQVNLEQCEKLYHKVVEDAGITKDDIVLDLYCGTGTIGMFLSKYAKKVYGVEVNHAAILNAEKNKIRNHVDNIEFICGDCGKVVPELKLKPTIVIVDPPRKGLDNNTIKQLLKWNTRTIIYVSCDPVTLARDLKVLQRQYTVTKITPVDMFPNTSHVECVSVLIRKAQ